METSKRGAPVQRARDRCEPGAVTVQKIPPEPLTERPGRSRFVSLGYDCPIDDPRGPSLVDSAGLVLCYLDAAMLVAG